MGRGWVRGARTRAGWGRAPRWPRAAPSAPPQRAQGRRPPPCSPPTRRRGCCKIAFCPLDSTRERREGDVWGRALRCGRKRRRPRRARCGRCRPRRRRRARRGGTGPPCLPGRPRRARRDKRVCFYAVCSWLRRRASQLGVLEKDAQARHASLLRGVRGEAEEVDVLPPGEGRSGRVCQRERAT